MSETSPISEEQVVRIESMVGQFYEVLTQALKFRVTVGDRNESSRMRADRMSDEMVEAANLAVYVEELLVGMLITQQHVHMLWFEEEAKHLQAMARLQSQQYVSKEGKMSGLIQSQNELYQIKCRVDACVDAGRRAVERLDTLRSTASRAAGLIYGPSS